MNRDLKLLKRTIITASFIFAFLMNGFGQTERSVDVIKRLKAEAFVMLTVHNPEQAMYYYRAIPSVTLSAHVLTKEAFEAYDNAGFPWKQSLAYVGPQIKPEGKELYSLIHARGATCMISAAPSYDKLKEPAERQQAYRDVFNDGVDILESDLPIEVGEAVQSLIPVKSKKKKFLHVSIF